MRFVLFFVLLPRLRSIGFSALWSVCFLGFSSADEAGQGSKVPLSVQTVLKKHCFECHNAKNQESGLDLETSKDTFDGQRDFALWVKVHDRVQAGEMPPEGGLPPETRTLLTSELFPVLLSFDQARVAQEGRGVTRRMNRFEFENTLRDVLGAPWLQIKDILPEDGESERFNKVGEALDVSHVQMSRYLQAAEQALRSVLDAIATEQPTTIKRYYAREQPAFSRKLRFSVFNKSPERAVFPLIGNQADLHLLNNDDAPMTVGESDPERREQESFGVVASSYEPIEVRFDKFTAPVAGRYKLRFKTHTFWAGPSDGEKWWRPDREKISAGRRQEPVTFYSEMPPRQMRLLGGFDSFPDPTVQEREVHLLEGESIRVDAARLFRSRPSNWHNPLAEKDGMPGVAFQWLEVEGPIEERSLVESQRMLLGDWNPKLDASPPLSVASKLIGDFANRVYRRPIPIGEELRFIDLFKNAMQAGNSFRESLLASYSAILCSPEFVCFKEDPGRLDDHAVACRLSYFLWNSEPDTILRELAAQKKLNHPVVIREQVERMLGDPKSSRFVNAFLDYWLDIRKVNDTSPDETLYPDYYLDDLLADSSIEETRSFFTELIRSDLPIRNLVDSDFCMINERLATHYGIPGVEGIGIRRVSVPAGSPRGGLLTQASVLKVTANGTTTSPVTRGAWIMERIVGDKPPAPPPSVPAIEPDTQGAKTIREQLEKHRTLADCNSCHAKIDPPGFALENFDIFGAWRVRYRSLGKEGERMDGYGKNGQPFTFRSATHVDASGTWTNGTHFKDITDFKRILREEEKKIANNLVRQLTLYATGAKVRFSDRPEIHRMVEQTHGKQLGIRSIIHAIVQSPLFLQK